MGVINIFNSNVGGSLSNSIGGYYGALVRIKPLVDMDIKGVYASVASEQSRLISPRIYRGSTVIASGPEKLGTTVAGGEATYFPLDSVVTLNANQIYYVGVFSHSVTVFSKGVGDETVSDVFFEKGTYAPLNFSSIWGYSFGIGLERVVNNPPTLNLTSPIGNLIPGTDGNCEDLSKWLVYSADVVTLSNTVKKYGSSSFKFTNSNNNGHRYKDNIQLDATKYYLALVDVFVESFSSGAYRILIPDSGGFNNSINATANTSKIGVWQTVYLKFTGKGNARVSLGNGTNTTGVTYMDGVRIYEIDKATYDKIDVDPNYSGEKLAQKFPYTDPTISQTLTEGSSYPIEGSATDADAGNVVTVKYKINNGTARAINSGVSDGSTPISFAKNLTYMNKRLWDGATDVIGYDLAENTDHTLTVLAEDDQGGKSPDQTRKFRVVWNRPPAISGQDENLGTLSSPPSKDFTVTDPEGNPFTIELYLDNEMLQSFPGIDGQTYTATIPQDKWLRTSLSQHTLKIRAIDNQGQYSDRNYTFTRVADRIELTLNYSNPKVKEFFSTDEKANRILVTLDAVIPSGSTLLVEACNNAYDPTPTWEDITAQVQAGRGYIFTNSTSTSGKWGINVHIRILKGTATETVLLNGFGGAFD